MFKGMMIKPVGSMLPTHAIDSPYVGASTIFIELPPAVIDDGYPSKRFHFDSELSSPSIMSDQGLEVAVLTANDMRLFLSLSRSELVANSDPSGVTFPIRGIAISKATYNRKISTRNQSISMGLEKKLKHFKKDIDLSLRSSLQIVKSELRDWHYFNFTSGFLEGEKRYDQYSINIPATYALELGVNGAYHFSRRISMELYTGYLFDVSKNEYQIGSRNNNFVASDEVSFASQLWNGDIDGNANVLSADGVTYVSSVTDFSSWLLRLKLSMNF